MSDSDDRFSSVFNLLDQLEDRPVGRFHLTAGLLGLLGTVAIWLVHSSQPLFSRLYDLGNGGRIALLLITVTPPLVGALALGQFVYPTTQAPDSARSGPLSAYLQQEQASRKWRLRLAATAVGAVNFLCVLFSSN